jgi:DNA-binding winged helix-turn-helix (wHTH) protein/TolB-like protein/Flp pilus assembly protein TadD
MSQKTEYLYEFGPFVLDTAQHLLLKENQPVQLTPKTLDTLVILVSNRGRLLSKSELMTAVWPDSFVEESNLTQQISMIRRALGESAGEDRFIVTVPGKGYRFAAQVTETIKPPLVREAPAAPSHPEERTSSRPVRRWRLPLATVALLFVVAASFLYHRTAVHDTPRSLAILPLQSLKEDARSDFLGFSLADAVITKLGYVRSLTVRPSSAISAYRNRTIDIAKVATELNVDTILTGNYIRDGDQLRITSQLIDVKTNNIIWRETFDVRYEKLLTLQDSVAQQIIKGLKLSLSPYEKEQLRPEKQISPLAYEYFLRGVDLYANNDFPMAAKLLQQATVMEPEYAPAWANLGRAYSASASFEFGGRDAYRDARSAYEKALSLHPAQLEASIFMANLHTDTGTVEEAVPLLRQTLQANPNNAEAHWELGYAYRFAGMLNESAAECEHARKLDPGVKLNSSALNTHLYMGAYDKFLQSLPRSGESPFILFYRGFGQYHKRNWNEAIKDFERAYELRRTPQTMVGKALSETLKKSNKTALEILHETEARMQERDVRDSEAAYKVAQAYAVSGDKASALRVLRRSIENGFFPYPYLKTDPLLDSLRKDPGFTSLLTLARERHDAFRKKFF